MEKQENYREQMAQYLKNYLGALYNDDESVLIAESEHIGGILDESLGLPKGLVHYLTVSRFANGMYWMSLGENPSNGEENIFNHYFGCWMENEDRDENNYETELKAFSCFWNISTNYLKMAHKMFGDCIAV